MAIKQPWILRTTTARLNQDITFGLAKSLTVDLS